MADTKCRDGGVGRVDLWGGLAGAVRSRRKSQAGARWRMLAEVVRRWFCRDTRIGNWLCRRGWLRRKTEPVAGVRVRGARFCFGRRYISPSDTETALDNAARLACVARRKRDDEEKRDGRIAAALSSLFLVVAVMAACFSRLGPAHAPASEPPTKRVVESPVVPAVEDRSAVAVSVPNVVRM